MTRSCSDRSSHHRSLTMAAAVGATIALLGLIDRVAGGAVRPLAGEDPFGENAGAALAVFVLLVALVMRARVSPVAPLLGSRDLRRARAPRDLQAVNARLVEEVQRSQASLRSAQQRIGSLENAQRQVLTAHDDVLQTIFASGLMLRTSLPGAAEDPSVQRTLDCLDDAVRSIRQVVKDLDSRLGAVKVP